MNILLLCTHLNPGGISRYTINLAIGLKRRGHTVYLATSAGTWIPEIEQEGVMCKRIPIHTKSIASPFILISFFVLIPFLLTNKITVVHANTRVTQALGTLIHSLLRIPLVCAFHGRYRASRGRQAIPLCGTKSIAVSNAVKTHLVNDLRIRQENVRVVHNGIDPKALARRERNRASLKRSDDDILIGILGRISKEKGHFLAAEALKLVSQKHPNVHLLINGTGKIEGELKLLLSAMKIRGNAHFFMLEGPTFLDFLDIVLIPSWKEGFGYVAIEAFAKKVPVIAHQVDGLAEIIRHKETGLLFSPYDSAKLADAIEELIDNPSLRDTLVANAQKELERFTLERMAQETENVYQEVIHG